MIEELRRKSRIRKVGDWGGKSNIEYAMLMIQLLGAPCWRVKKGQKSHNEMELNKNSRQSHTEDVGGWMSFVGVGMDCRCRFLKIT